MEPYNIKKIPKIQVMIRKRPLTRKEKKKNEKDIIDVEQGCTVIVNEKK